MYAIIKVRGIIGSNVKKRTTLSFLNLERINHCVIVPETQDYKGMLKRVADYVTWGEIKEKELEKLILKRGRKKGNKRLTEEESHKITKLILKDNSVKTSEIKPVFRLSPPKKGYRATKLFFPKGDLGYRGEKINDLLNKMM